MMAKTPGLSDLALHGGRPVHTRPWRTGSFHFAEELAALEELLSGPALPLARGRAVMAYRQELQDLYGMRCAVPTSSGSAAIHVGLFAAGVGAGDEVIVSPLTDYGSIMGIFQLNAIPVFADVQPGGLLMDPKSVAEKITPHTRVIMPVHNGGYAVDMGAIVKLARRHDLIVLEDCAQSHLASIKGKYLGTFGHLGAWSTNESKHMKSGEGGFLLTNDRRMAELADLFSDKCYPRFPGAPPTPAFPALNVRLSDVNAALARVQLRRLPKWTAQRQAFGQAFCEGIAGVPGVKPQPQPRGALPSFWWALFALDPQILGAKADRFCEMLRAEGIPASAGPQRYVPGWEVFRQLHRNPGAFRAYRPGRLRKGFYPLDVAPNAQSAAERLAVINITQHNTPGEARAAARAVRKVAGALLGRAL
jgi:dTDP-4-amino-4,6-dideoxygalactose transaminase